MTPLLGRTQLKRLQYDRCFRNKLLGKLDFLCSHRYNQHWLNRHRVVAKIIFQHPKNNPWLRAILCILWDKVLAHLGHLHSAWVRRLKIDLSPLRHPWDRASQFSCSNRISCFGVACTDHSV